mmetsp:Transcript_33027/g.65458  ORF Transcript_33027/g.65458 Transcript_33027/m.65458 type:complete len:705 (+) Transcript_33027:569-2683(+)
MTVVLSAEFKSPPGPISRELLFLCHPRLSPTDSTLQKTVQGREKIHVSHVHEPQSLVRLVVMSVAVAVTVVAVAVFHLHHNRCGGLLGSHRDGDILEGSGHDGKAGAAGGGGGSRERAGGDAGLGDRIEDVARCRARVDRFSGLGLGADLRVSLLSVALGTFQGRVNSDILTADAVGQLGIDRGFVVTRDDAHHVGGHMGIENASNGGGTVLAAGRLDLHLVSLGALKHRVDCGGHDAPSEEEGGPGRACVLDGSCEGSHAHLSDQHGVRGADKVNGSLIPGGTGLAFHHEARGALLDGVQHFLSEADPVVEIISRGAVCEGGLHGGHRAGGRAGLAAGGDEVHGVALGTFVLGLVPDLVLTGGHASLGASGRDHGSKPAQRDRGNARLSVAALPLGLGAVRSVPGRALQLPSGDLSGHAVLVVHESSLSAHGCGRHRRGLLTHPCTVAETLGAGDGGGHLALSHAPPVGGDSAGRAEDIHRGSGLIKALLPASCESLRAHLGGRGGFLQLAVCLSHHGVTRGAVLLHLHLCGPLAIPPGENVVRGAPEKGLALARDVAHVQSVGALRIGRADGCGRVTHVPDAVVPFKLKLRGADGLLRCRHEAHTLLARSKSESLIAAGDRERAWPFVGHLSIFRCGRGLVVLCRCARQPRNDNSSKFHVASKLSSCKVVPQLFVLPLCIVSWAVRQSSECRYKYSATAECR